MGDWKGIRNIKVSETDLPSQVFFWNRYGVEEPVRQLTNPGLPEKMAIKIRVGGGGWRHYLVAVTEW